MNKTLKSILNILSYILIAFLVFVILVNLHNVIVSKLFGVRNPTFLGLTSAIVDTNSMDGDNPDSFPGNTYIVTFKSGNYKVGDIITFDTGGRITTTHRIIDINEEGYLTKGDYNNTDDGFRLPKEAIVGKVIIIIKGGGTVLKYLRTPAGLCALAISMLLIAAIPAMLGKKNDSQTESSVTPTEDNANNAP